MGKNIALLYMSAYFAQPAKDTGLLPLSTSAIEQTLGDVAFYLFKLKECKATAPVGIELLDSNKAF